MCEFEAAGVAVVILYFNYGPKLREMAPQFA